MMGRGGDSLSHLGTRGAFTHLSQSKAPSRMARTSSIYCDEAPGTSRGREPSPLSSVSYRAFIWVSVRGGFLSLKTFSRIFLNIAIAKCQTHTESCRQPLFFFYIYII